MKRLDDWMTFSHASRVINKNRNYFINRYRKNPDFFPEKCLLEIDGIKFINKDGIKIVQSKIKKVVAHVNTTNIFVGLTVKVKFLLCFATLL